MKRHLLSWHLAMLLSALASTCQAALITYVDAAHGVNTTLADGTAFVPDPTRENNDNAWSQRAFANNATIYVSNEAGTAANFEDAPGLATTISGLVAGNNYEVFAYFWDGNGNWRLKASLTQMPPLPNDPSVSFSANGSATSTQAPQAVAADFTVAPLILEGDRRMLQASLGRIRADANGEIVVFIDDLEHPAEGGGVLRTWYDGVGHALVPEPASLAMLCAGLGMVFMFRFRRAA